MLGSRALVILSGGQDSTTCLYWAKQRFKEVRALTFDYGQRHRIELEAAAEVALRACVFHDVVTLPPGVLVSTSPLVDHSRTVEHYQSPNEMPDGVEPTFVPCRNLLFLTLAANRAAAWRAGALVIGVSQEDYGGYPDCREEFLEAADRAINLAVFGREYKPERGAGSWSTGGINLHAPLLHESKAGTVALALQMDGCYQALAYTHTCYDGQYPPNPFNHASMLRARGFYEAGVPDPLIVRAKQEGLLPYEHPDHGYLVGEVK